MGRHAHHPDDRGQRQVEALSAYGVPERDIARVVGVDPKTLQKHYRDELDLGSTKATAKVAEFLFRKATPEGPRRVIEAKIMNTWKQLTQTRFCGRPKHAKDGEFKCIQAGRSS
ncbi:MAG: hypothetical protein QG597_4127 [Actinomycetota bacterium]|nr:hypothetical protein [Actinomycetota bacterium]